MTFDEAVAYLDSLMPLGMRLTLDRIRALCEEFGHPERAFRTVHVAGTNGKGSTATMVSRILTCSGLRTGLFVSPYVLTVRERAQVDGVFIPERTFADLIEEVRPVAERISHSAGHPTEFEVKTIVALLHFARSQVDYAVMEVGLGGRYDSTNVIVPDVAAITNVTLDHVDRLGDTVEKIAWEKAGIIKDRVPCVTAAEGAALSVVEAEARAHEAPLYRLGREITIEFEQDGSFAVAVTGKRYGGLRIGMLGEFQRTNAAVAVAAAHLLADKGVPVSAEAVREGLATAYAPGRLEVLRRNPTLVLDGAHNADGAAKLRRALTTLFNYRRLILVAGMTRGHSISDVIGTLAPIAHLVIATAPASPRAASAPDVASAAEACGTPARVVHGVPSAVRAALEEATPDDLVCVAGSFYTVGEVPRDGNQREGAGEGAAGAATATANQERVES